VQRTVCTGAHYSAASRDAEGGEGDGDGEGEGEGKRVNSARSEPREWAARVSGSLAPFRALRRSAL